MSHTNPINRTTIEGWLKSQRLEKRAQERAQSIHKQSWLSIAFAHPGHVECPMCEEKVERLRQAVLILMLAANLNFSQRDALYEMLGES